MSPSRLMAIMDPLLNTGFLWRCLAAYAGIKSDDESPHDDLEIITMPDATDTPSEKEQKVDKVTSPPDQAIPIPNDSSSCEQNSKSPEYIRGDTYYSRLGIFSRDLFPPFFTLINLGAIMGSRQAYLLRKLRESTLPNSPYMSPLRASDDILRQFPTTYLVVSYSYLISFSLIG